MSVKRITAIKRTFGETLQGVSFFLSFVLLFLFPFPFLLLSSSSLSSSVLPLLPLHLVLSVAETAKTVGDSSHGQTTRSITIGKLNDNDVSTSKSWGRVSLIGNSIWKLGLVLCLLAERRWIRFRLVYAIECNGIYFSPTLRSLLSSFPFSFCFSFFLVSGKRCFLVFWYS